VSRALDVPDLDEAVWGLGARRHDMMASRIFRAALSVGVPSLP